MSLKSSHPPHSPSRVGPKSNKLGAFLSGVTRTARTEQHNKWHLEDSPAHSEDSNHVLKASLIIVASPVGR